MGVVALVLGGVGCRDADPGDPSRDDGDKMPLATGGTSEGTSTGEVFEPGEDATDQCGLAPTIGAGRYYGSLRGNSSELDGACGRGGPDAFFRLDVPRRSDVRIQGLGVGFIPRVGVLPNACTPEWDDRTMLCDDGLGTWLLDVPAGASLVVSIGTDADNPALGQPPPMVGADPLDFAVDVELRNVLAEGEPCEPPGRGRCGPGTACLPVPPADDAPPDEPVPMGSVCVRLEGDTCESARVVPVTDAGVLEGIDPQAPHTDAHVHGCGGARRREVVWWLALPDAGPHRIVVSADTPQVGLALREPGCATTDERACVSADDLPPTLTAELEGDGAFLFIELPPLPTNDDEEGTGTGTGDTGDPPGEEAPIVIAVALAEPPPGP